MEDVLVLEDFLDRHPLDRLAAFTAYSEFRSPDAKAIVDLAMYNYIEVGCAMGLCIHPTSLL